MRVIPLRDRVADVLAQDRMACKLGERRFAADQLAAAGGVGPGQHADPLSVLAGNDGVLQRRRNGGECSHAQRPNRYPGAGGELEVLGQSSVEYDALARIAGIGKAHGVTGLVKTFLVEGCAREVFPLPVAGHDVWPAHAHLKLVAGRNKLELDAGDRHTDRTRALDYKMRGGRER